MPSSAWKKDVCRSEEHTSELQSLTNVVCRLLLEKKSRRISAAARVGASALRRADRPFRAPGAGGRPARSGAPGGPATLRRGGGFFFFFNDTATTEIYTLSLHNALPICKTLPGATPAGGRPARAKSARSQ